MRPIALLLAVCAVLGGCADAAPQPFDATVTFAVHGPEGAAEPGVLTEQATTFLVVEKAGRTSLVDAWAAEAPKGTMYGRHNFPPGTTAQAMVAYYRVLLLNAGWQAADVRARGEEARLELRGVTRIEAGANREEIRVKIERLDPKPSPR